MLSRVEDVGIMFLEIAAEMSFHTASAQTCHWCQTRLTADSSPFMTLLRAAASDTNGGLRTDAAARNQIPKSGSTVPSKEVSITPKSGSTPPLRPEIAFSSCVGCPNNGKSRTGGLIRVQNSYYTQEMVFYLGNVVSIRKGVIRLRLFINGEGTCWMMKAANK